MLHQNDEKIYAENYVRTLLGGGNKNFDPSQLCEECHELDICNVLFNAYQDGGTDEVKFQWEQTVKPNYPDFYKRVQFNPFLRRSDLHNLESPTWLLENRIFENGFTVLYGPSGSGKSFLALNDVNHLVQQGKRVLYIASESIESYNPRLMAWEQHHKTILPDSLAWYDTRYYELDLSTDESVYKLIDMVQDVGQSFDLIVIDTLASAMTGDENSTQDMNAVVRNVRRFITELDTAVLLVHHTGKNNELERGSSALRGASDVMLKISQDSDGIIFLNCEKSKHTKAWESEKFQLIPVDLGNGETNAVILPTEKIMINNKSVPKNARIILTYLTKVTEPIRHKDIVTYAKHISISRTGAKNSINQLLDKKHIHVRDDGKYEATEQGITFIDEYNRLNPTKPTNLTDFSEVKKHAKNSS